MRVWPQELLPRYDRSRKGHVSNAFGPRVHLFYLIFARLQWSAWHDHTGISAMPDVVSGLSVGGDGKSMREGPQRVGWRRLLRGTSPYRGP